MAARALEERLASIDELRRKPKLSIVSGKGRPPPRERPADFDVIFREIGRLECETYFRASRITINRWLDETPGDIFAGKQRSGKERLIEERRQFVEHERKTLGPLREHVRKGPKEPEAKKPKPSKAKKDRCKVDPCIARQASHFLRQPCHGGWRVSLTEQGDYAVGLMRMSPRTMLDFATARGFDVKTAKLSCELEPIEAVEEQRMRKHHRWA